MSFVDRLAGFIAGVSSYRLGLVGWQLVPVDELVRGMAEQQVCLSF